MRAAAGSSNGWRSTAIRVDPKIDAVDWVERIPFAETRNYVERVMENLQVYRKRFGDVIATIEPNLHRPVALLWTLSAIR